jgi:hypothetical protein
MSHDVPNATTVSQAARRVTCLALAAFLVVSANFSANTTFGQVDLGPYHITVDGVTYSGTHTNPGNFWWHNNQATRNEVIINGGNVGNANSAYPHNPARPSVINYASVTGTERAGSSLTNSHSGHIGTVDIFNRGNVSQGVMIGTDPSRMHTPTIGTANVHEGGSLRNWYQSHVETVNVYGGSVQHSARDSYPNVRPGFIHEATIGTVNLYTGSVTSGDHGSIQTANVYGGQLDNMNNSTIGRVHLSGGTVNNDNRINNLEYTGGYYNVHQLSPQSWWGNEWEGNGVIGNLNVAADSSGIDWSFVNHLRFDSNNAGLISLAGHDRMDHIGFRNIFVTDDADLRYGGISMNLSGMHLGDFANFNDWTLGLLDTYGDGFSYTFSWGSLLGTSDVEFWDDLRYVELVWGSNTAVLFDGNAWATGWGVSLAGITAIAPEPAAIPEPATLAIVGLGLAGLGLARRRRK